MWRDYSLRIILRKFQAQIDIEITVLEDDGGVLAASLMAASLALCHSGIPTLDICLAAHVAITTDDYIIVDPFKKDMTSNDCLSVTVGIMPSLNQVICYQQSGISSREQLSKAFSTALTAAFHLYKIFCDALRVSQQT